MIMDKISNSEYDNGVRHNVEGFVLDRLSSKHDPGGDPLVGIGDLSAIGRNPAQVGREAPQGNRQRLRVAIIDGHPGQKFDELAQIALLHVTE